MQLILASVCKDFEAQLVEFNGEHDHVHLLINYPPKVALSKVAVLLRIVLWRCAHRCASALHRGTANTPTKDAYGIRALNPGLNSEAARTWVKDLLPRPARPGAAPQAEHRPAAGPVGRQASALPAPEGALQPAAWRRRWHCGLARMNIQATSTNGSVSAGRPSGSNAAATAAYTTAVASAARKA